MSVTLVFHLQHPDAMLLFFMKVELQNIKDYWIPEPDQKSKKALCTQLLIISKYVERFSKVNTDIHLWMNEYTYVSKYLIEKEKISSCMYWKFIAIK